MTTITKYSISVGGAGFYLSSRCTPWREHKNVTFGYYSVCISSVPVASKLRLLLSVDDFSLHFHSLGMLGVVRLKYVTSHDSRKMDDLLGACEAGDIVAVRRAIANGVDPNKYALHNLRSIGYTERVTPLHVACW